jgi:anti-sigma factor RsiW
MAQTAAYRQRGGGDFKMNCQYTRVHLMAYLDDELDVSDTLHLEQHLSDCKECGTTREETLSLRSMLRDPALYSKPPEALTNRIKFAVRQAAKQEAAPAFPPMYRWATVAAALIAMVSVGALLNRYSHRDLLTSEIVDSHVRSLQGDHLIDVPSSDRHTVKPWFQGKLDFSPPVPDLSGRGWTLTGGRLDYLDNRPVAALVYQRGKHDINVYIWPSGKDGGGLQRTEARGYQVFHWDQEAMSYWVISDLNSADLQEFAQALRGR